jgi:hypothetical protein
VLCAQDDSVRARTEFFYHDAKGARFQEFFATHT